MVFSPTEGLSLKLIQLPMVDEPTQIGVVHPDGQVSVGVSPLVTNLCARCPRC